MHELQGPKTKLWIRKLPIDDCLRIPITRFRCGSHNLPISERRFDGICDHHVCPLCFEDIGDEFHYVLACPAFDTYRLKFLDHTILKGVCPFKKAFFSFSHQWNLRVFSRLMMWDSSRCEQYALFYIKIKFGRNPKRYLNLVVSMSIMFEFGWYDIVNNRYNEIS